jgi:hypothetical protein
MKVKNKETVGSFQEALEFYHQSRQETSKLLLEAKDLSAELGSSASMLSEHGRPIPLDLSEPKKIKLSEIETWLGTSLGYYAESLESLLPSIDNSIKIVPNLLKGIVEEAQKGTSQLSKEVKKAQKKIAKGNDATSELNEIEKSLNQKVLKLNFFKEEVEERFEEFKDGLIEYVSTYSILKHLVRCTDYVMDWNPNNIKQFVKELTNFKGPIK